MSMEHFSAWTGQLCVDRVCRSAHEVAQLQLDWRQLLNHSNLTAPASSCGRERKYCRPLAIDPWPSCHKQSTDTAQTCVTPNPQCGVTCSGSIGEESFAMIALLALAHGAGHVNQTGIMRPWGSARSRPAGESGGAGTRPLLRGGTFLEIGANNGFASNTRYLEECLGWHGLLIEGHPRNFAALEKTRPRALKLASAVCVQHGMANFSRRPGPSSGLLSEMSASHRVRFRHSRGVNGTLQVPCGPLRDWLGLLRLSHIDFFSLDVEGAEMLVLDTIDWSSTSVGVLIVECSRNHCMGAKDLLVKRTLIRVGFRLVALVKVRSDIANLAFVNASTGWVGSWVGS